MCKSSCAIVHLLASLLIVGANNIALRAGEEYPVLIQECSGSAALSLNVKANSSVSVVCAGADTGVYTALSALNVLDVNEVLTSSDVPDDTYAVTIQAVNSTTVSYTISLVCTAAASGPSVGLIVGLLVGALVLLAICVRMIRPLIKLREFTPRGR